MSESTNATQPLVYVDRGLILFCDDTAFAIPVNSIDTSEKVVRWIPQLLQKQWFTKRTLEYLLVILETMEPSES